MPEQIRVGDRTRTFLVVGTPDSTRSRDLVLIFHGSKQDGATHRRFTGGMWDALAADGDAVVAYLDGYRGNWNDARRESSFPARRENVDDVAFTTAVIDRLATTHGIDPVRVFGVGYSNGGQMVLRLLHERPLLLAGAVVIAATMPAPENFLVPDAADQGVPTLLIHGTKDPIVAYEGGTMAWWAQKVFRVGGASLSAPETARYFADRNGISAPPTTSELPAASPRTRVERIAYRDEGAPPVDLYTIVGGGHTVPGPHAAPAILGRTSADVSTAQLAREFFTMGIRPSLQ